jgi:hypothetical protein
MALVKFVIDIIRILFMTGQIVVGTIQEIKKKNEKND